MTTPPLVLSIQSHVAYGHVGNDAAMLPLQLLGIEPVAVHTVQFSNHTGYGEFKGQVFTPAHVQDVLDGLRARGVLERCTAVLSGYLGDAGVGEAILPPCRKCGLHSPRLTTCATRSWAMWGAACLCAPASPNFCANVRYRKPASSRPIITSLNCSAAAR